MRRLRRPNAIGWAVTSVVVDAFEGQTGRRIAHVGIEIFEAQPLFAAGNAPSTVIAVVGAIRVAAPLEHGLPNMVNGGARPAMLGGVRSNDLALKAAATRRSAAIQRSPEHGPFRAAIANAIPNNIDCVTVAMSLWMNPKNPPATEAFSSNVNSSISPAADDGA